MKKKVSKSKTQLWVGAIILIIFIQLAKLAHQNEWFSNKNSNLKNKEDFKKLLDSDENKKVKELIEQLQKCNPDLYVYAFKDDNIFHLINVDNSMNDRIDINVEEENC